MDAPSRVMMLITAKNALVPYSDEAGPRMISTRSNIATSTFSSLPANPWS